MEIEIKDINNKFVEKLVLEKLNIEDFNHLLYQRNRLNNNNLRTGNQSAKTRSEVSVSRRKVYKQKGTGNARRGANSTPLRRGGGCVFAPKPRKYSFKINKKVNKKMWFVLANHILKNAIVIHSDTNKYTKTADFINKYEKIISDSLFIFIKNDDITYKVFNNLKNIEKILLSQINIQKILLNNQFIISINVLNELKQLINVEKNNG